MNQPLELSEMFLSPEEIEHRERKQQQQLKDYVNAKHMFSTVVTDKRLASPDDRPDLIKFTDDDRNGYCDFDQDGKLHSINYAPGETDTARATRFHEMMHAKHTRIELFGDFAKPVVNAVEDMRVYKNYSPNGLPEEIINGSIVSASEAVLESHDMIKAGMHKRLSYNQACDEVRALLGALSITRTFGKRKLSEDITNIKEWTDDNAVRCLQTLSGEFGERLFSVSEINYFIRASLNACDPMVGKDRPDLDPPVIFEDGGREIIREYFSIAIDHLQQLFPVPPKPPEIKLPPKPGQTKDDKNPGHNQAIEDSNSSDGWDIKVEDLVRDRPTRKHSDGPARVPNPIYGRLNRRGIIPALVNRDPSQLFNKVRIKPQSVGGTVLIDASSSMHTNATNLQELCELLPQATVAFYAGSSSRKFGRVWVWARDGQQASEVPQRVINGLANTCDHFALQWLQNEPGPRLFISDMGFGSGQTGQRTMAHQLHRQMKEWGDLISLEVDSIDEAVSIIKSASKR